ncbi:hypothetical protein RSAG8_03991, partial [Rhizoctonia solani AG-8 WAC10335]
MWLHGIQPESVDINRALVHELIAYNSPAFILFTALLASADNRRPHNFAIPSIKSTLTDTHAKVAATKDKLQPVVGEPDVSTNNIGTGANITDPYESAQHVRAGGIQDPIERSNRLAEQANQLIEQSNLLAERTNLLLERSIDPAEQPSRPSEHVNQLLERLNEHLDQSNRLAKESTQPVEQLGDALKNINRVLVRIQHAIVRNHKGNTISALDCLVNEKGETPGISRTTGEMTFWNFSQDNEDRLPVVIDGVYQNSYIYDTYLGEFVRFYGIDDGLCEDRPGSQLKEGKVNAARARLAAYLSSCLG